MQGAKKATSFHLMFQALVSKQPKMIPPERFANQKQMLFVIWRPHRRLKDKSKSNLAKTLYFDRHRIGFAPFQTRIFFSS